MLHGAGLTTEDHDPEGTLLAMVRGIVGPDCAGRRHLSTCTPTSPAPMSKLVDAFIGYRTNPHLDMRERGAEAAQVLRRLIGGTQTHLARVRLPIVPPTVTQLTGKDAPNRPYGELIDLGQQRMHEAPYAGRVLNVSVMGGFAFADTPFNGLTVVVTATDADGGDGLAREIAEAGWARRDRFRPRLTRWRRPCGWRRTTEDRAQPPLIFADVADNPGGGGRGNTMWILQAFLDAPACSDALVGVIHDPALAAEAHRARRGRDVHRAFQSRRRRRSSPSRSARRRRCGGCCDGRCAAGAASTPTTRWTSGRRRRCDLGGITVVVLSQSRTNAPTRCSSRRSASTSPPRAWWW